MSTDVTVAPSTDRVRVVLLDIEGTTTPVAFVHDVLFPYARRHLAGWVQHHLATPEGRQIATMFAREHRDDVERGEAAPPWPGDGPADAAAVVACAYWLMDHDRKSPGLKTLQGLIWEEGFVAGELRGYVYDDVPLAMRRWRREGIRVAVYSSGSVLTQRRLFQSTGHGDLLPLISGFFDTAVGPKVHADSYARIATQLGCQPSSVLFISDVGRELDAARAAGCQVLLAVRPGNPEQPDAGRFPSVADFHDVLSIDEAG